MESGVTCSSHPTADTARRYIKRAEVNRPTSIPSSLVHSAFSDYRTMFTGLVEKIGSEPPPSLFFI